MKAKWHLHYPFIFSNRFSFGWRHRLPPERNLYVPIGLSSIHSSHLQLARHCHADATSLRQCEKAAKFFGWKIVTQVPVKPTHIQLINCGFKLKGALLCFLISRYRTCGPVAGPFFVLIFTICHILLQFFEWLYPRHLIDIAPDYNGWEKRKSYEPLRQKQQTNTLKIPTAFTAVRLARGCL